MTGFPFAQSDIDGTRFAIEAVLRRSEASLKASIVRHGSGTVERLPYQNRFLDTPNTPR
jgi:hypothetical protein